MARKPKDIVAKTVPVLLAAGSVLFFSFFYNDHLYQREQLQMFLLTREYLLKSLSVNGGLVFYAGEFLVQFFRIPVASSLIIAALLLLLYVSVKRLSASITGKNSFNLFYLIAPLGYCLLLTDQFYYLSGLIALIISVVASSCYVRRIKSGVSFLAGMILLPVVYWIAGGAYLVLLANMIIAEVLLSPGYHQKRSIKSLAFRIISFVLISITAPLIARHYLVTATLLQSFMSEAFYAVRIFFPLPLFLVFISIPLTILVQAWIPDDLPARQLIRINMVTAVILVVLTFWGFWRLPDYTGEKRMAYENMVYDRKWEKIITRAESESPSEPVSIAAVNLALAQTGRLSTGMFRFDQHAGDLFIPYERKGMTPFMSSEPYFYLGLVNFSQMFAVETIESTVDSRLPSRAVIRAAETYMLNGQYDISRKYLNLLRHTLFYRRWALQKLRLVDSGKDVTDDPELAPVKKRMPAYDFFYDYARTDVALSYLLISDNGNRMAFEYLMAWYLLNKDFDGFLQNLGRMKALGYDVTPAAWQEAIAYVLTRLEEKPAEMMSLVTDRSVAENLQKYAEAYAANRLDTAAMKLRFGNTYWYYLHYK